MGVVAGKKFPIHLHEEGWLELAAAKSWAVITFLLSNTVQFHRTVSNLALKGLSHKFESG